MRIDRISYQELEKEDDDVTVDLFDDKEDKEEEDKTDDEQADEEEDKEDEDEDEDKEDKDKDKEEPEVLTRADLAEINKKFPDLFKEYPTLKHAFFREQEFTSMFGTVEEAKKALDVQEAYDTMVEAVVSGNAEVFLQNLKEEDEKGLEKFSANFLPSLQKINKDLYIDLVSPVIANAIKSVYEHGKELTSEVDKKNIQNAAKLVRRVLFGGDINDIEKEVKPLIAKDDKDDKDKKDLEDGLKQKYATLYGEVSNACFGLLDKHIEKGIEDLAKEKGLHRLVLKEIKERVLNEMDKDKDYVNRMNSLWKRERRNGFSGTLKSSFTTTFLAKAKTLIPKHRLEVRKEMGRKEEKTTEKKEPTRISGGKQSGNAGEKMTPEKAKKEGLTTRQVFD